MDTHPKRVGKGSTPREGARAPAALDGEGNKDPTLAPSAALFCGDLAIDRVGQRATIRGRDLHLTRRELGLLLWLADHANRVQRSSDLLAHVWMLPDDDSSNLVAVYIRRLRRKLGADAAMIKTIRGVGYRMRPVPCEA